MEAAAAEESNNDAAAVEASADEEVERQLGRRLEGLWSDRARNDPSSSDIERLNSCLDKIPVLSFPPLPKKRVIEINSDASLAEAVSLLASNGILSAPVRDVSAPEDASWIDKYIGIAEFSGIVMWLLHQSEYAAGTTVAAAGVVSQSGCVSGSDNSNAESSVLLRGDFFEMLTSSEYYRSTKVEDIAGSFRWAPFLALQTTDSFLTMLLLLSKYRMKFLPVVDIGEGKIENIITQSSILNMLAKCVGLPWFENWGQKSLLDVELPTMRPERMLKIGEDQPVLKAFKLMREKSVSGLPVMAEGSNKPVGNISLRDVQYLLLAPEIFKDFRSVTAKDFLNAVRVHRSQKQESARVIEGVITCQRNDTIEEVILKLNNAKIQRLYVVNDDGDLQGVVTMRDIISKFVQEPPGYFGDFFYGVVPSPRNSRV